MNFNSMGQFFSFIKKRIFFFFILFSGFSVYGQFYHGIEIGSSITNADFMMDTSREPKSSLGFSLGYAAERDLSESVYVKVAVLATKRSFNANNIRGINTSKEKWGLNVIEIPINLGYYLNYNNRNFQIFVEGGLNVDYNMRGFIKNDDETITLDIGNEGSVNRISTGVNVGVGLLFSKRTKVRLYYYNGLTNVLTTENDQWKNKAIGISLNYFLKKREPY